MHIEVWVASMDLNVDARKSMSFMLMYYVCQQLGLQGHKLQLLAGISH